MKSPDGYSTSKIDLVVVVPHRTLRYFLTIADLVVVAPHRTLRYFLTIVTNLVVVVPYPSIFPYCPHTISDVQTEPYLPHPSEQEDFTPDQ